MFRHQHLIRYLFKRELSEIYVSIGLRDLALSMTGIFVPLYLYIDLKYSLTSVMLFFLVYSLAMLFSSPFAGKFVSRYGIKHGILMSMFGFVIYTLLLIVLPYSHMYFLPALIWGIANSFYWVSFHSDFTKFSDGKNRGQEVSLWFITAYLGILLGPILGSIIITFLGFETLFVIVSLLLLLSAAPLFLSSEFYQKTHFSFKHIFKEFPLKETYIYITMGLRVVVSQAALPIFVFIILNEYISLGAVASIAALGSMIIGFFVGKLSRNEARERTMFRYGALFHSIGWFILFFVKSFVQVAVVNLYLAVSYIFVDIPHHTLVYGEAKKSGKILEYFVYRETMLNIGRVLGILIIILTGKIIVGLIVSAVGLLPWFFL